MGELLLEQKVSLTDKILEEAVLNVIESFVEDRGELPTVERIAHELPGYELASIKQAMGELSRKDKFTPFRRRAAVLQQLRREQEAGLYSGYRDGFVQQREGSRTGAHDISRRELERRAYTLSRIRSNLSGMKVEYVFIVSSTRGFNEYRKVRAQEKRIGQLGKYSNDLFNSMFKNW